MFLCISCVIVINKVMNVVTIIVIIVTALIFKLTKYMPKAEA